MEVIHVGIRMPDPELAEALARAVASSSHHIHCHLEEGDHDLYLLTESMDLPSGVSEEQCIRLFRNREQASILKRRIWIYEDASVIADAILYAYYMRTGHLPEYRGKKNLRLIVFAQASGGNGVTACALTAGAILSAEFGRSVLYLNTSAYDDSARYLREAKEDLLRLVIFHLKRRMPFLLKPFLRSENGFCRIPGSRMQNYLAEMDEKLMDDLLTVIADQGDCDLLLVDIGSWLPPVNQILLRTADLVVLVTGRRDRDAFTSDRCALIRGSSKRVLCIDNMADPVRMTACEDHIPVAFDPASFATIGKQVQVSSGKTFWMDMTAVCERIEEV